jgi:hypothetical protein
MTIECQAAEYLLSVEGASEQVMLRTTGDGSIADAKELVLRGAGYATQEAAQTAGIRWVSSLIVAFAANGLGADLGLRGSDPWIDPDYLAQQATEEWPVILPDLRSLMVFEAEPKPNFMRLNIGDWTVGKPVDRLRKAVLAAYADADEVTERQYLAFSTYSRSFGLDPDARLVTLVSAVELLLEFRPRPPDARDMVDSWIAQVDRSSLPKNEKDSLTGSLEFLRNESIGQAVRRLALKLGARRYMGERAGKFLTACYTLRSQLVHGTAIPPLDEVQLRAAELERMVGDLISVSLLDNFDYGPHSLYVGVEPADDWDGDPDNVPLKPVSHLFEDDSSGDG